MKREMTSGVLVSAGGKTKPLTQTRGDFKKEVRLLYCLKELLFNELTRQ